MNRSYTLPPNAGERIAAMKTVFRDILLGLLIGLLLTPSTANAQFTVFDPAQYALQIERQIEEANRWLERVKQYSEEINKLAEQLSTMKGVLGQAEKLVLHNNNLTRTMAQLGQTVRDVFALKRAIETMVISRLSMIKSIKTRLMSGIFDPEADLRDFEDYLRNSIGRTSQNKIATMNRIAMFDATLSRLYHDLQTAQARQAGAATQMKQAKDKLDAELAKPQVEQCATCISDLKLEIASCEKMIVDLDTQITNLSTQIEDRVKLYNLTMEERVRIANRVRATDEAWSSLNIVKDSVFQAIEEGGMPAPSPTP
jgi:predicted  nucleic acid-binding Zn-ribbon protein